MYNLSKKGQMTTMVAHFTLILGILCGASVLILLITAISISKNKDKLTSFECKILFFVVFAVCFGAIILYILSNLELFFALIKG